jgi:excisionase family DNA binding protein
MTYDWGTAMTEHQVITVAVAAALLNVSDETVRRLYREGHLTGFRKTGVKRSEIWLYRDSVEHYMQKVQGRQPSGAD